MSFFSPQSFPAARGYFDGYTPTIWGGRNGIIWLAVIRGMVHDSQRQKSQTLVSSRPRITAHDHPVGMYRNSAKLAGPD